MALNTFCTLHDGAIPKYLKNEQSIKISIFEEDLDVTLRTKQFSADLFTVHYSWESPIREGKETFLTRKQILAPLLKKLMLSEVVSKRQMSIEHIYAFYVKGDLSYIVGKPWRVHVEGKLTHAEFKILEKPNSQNISKIEGVFFSLENENLNPKDWQQFAFKACTETIDQYNEEIEQENHEVYLKIKELEEENAVLEIEAEDLQEKARRAQKSLKKWRRRLYFVLAALFIVSVYAYYDHFRRIKKILDLQKG